MRRVEKKPREHQGSWSTGLLESDFSGVYKSQAGLQGAGGDTFLGDIKTVCYMAVW